MRGDQGDIDSSDIQGTLTVPRSTFRSAIGEWLFAFNPFDEGCDDEDEEEGMRIANVTWRSVLWFMFLWAVWVLAVDGRGGVGFENGERGRCQRDVGLLLVACGG